MAVLDFPSYVNESFMSLEKTCAQSTINSLKPLSGSEMGEVVMPLLGENSSDSHLLESRGNALIGMLE